MCQVCRMPFIYYMRFEDQYFVVEECKFALPLHGCNGTCVLVGFAVERVVVLQKKLSFVQRNIFLASKCPLFA